MRREQEIILQDRGKEIVFRIKEMSALQLEKWLMRALLALCKSRHVNKEENSNNTNKSKVLIDALFDGRFLEVFCNADFEEIEPLLDELLTCVQRRVDNGYMQVNSSTIESYVEDVRTLFELRMEVLKFNLDFLLEMNQEEARLEEVENGKGKMPTFNMKIPKQAM